jgi:fused signal recognition particle receptor
MNLFKNLNFDKLKESLSKTRAKIVDRITETISGKAKLDSELLDEIEEILLSSDVGFETTNKIIDNSRSKLKNESDRTSNRIIEIIKNEMISILQQNPSSDIAVNYENYKPYVILIVGVNGVGKTTTIGKLAYNFKQSGLEVMIASADTFRAAANEQLDIWAKRADVEIIKRESGADPSSVVFEALEIAKQRKIDIVLIDTAGRLHTKSNLMEELKKIKKVMKKVLDYAPNETYLILDGTTGQNSIVQSKTFKETTDINGLIITKLDGTAKGGVIFQICSSESIPVKYIGVGEGINDLQNFDPNAFVEALFNK